MQTWMLDPSGDLAESEGRPVHIQGAQAIGQAIMIRLKWFSGEWFRDRTAGAKWYEYGIGKRNPDLIVLKSMIGIVIRATPGVVQIVSLALTLNTSRQLRITAVVKVDDPDRTQIKIQTSLIPEPPAPPAPEPIPLESIAGALIGDLDLQGVENAEDAPFIEGVTLT